ncbi:hypothetical protein CE91St30_23510 [Raoultibacter timonensis]|uniref:Uncharacterized protein n=1 Tax=Raoultibacter timonensis TaxID=1907662 RepID=A0ABM7WKX6_9ACTN|nr:hypothetical protein CE91St30_23510 [Raoultibacter timonensis]BDF51622.1 hypothetical protein CE91St31_23520 [Raoultibacter timonensis]
MLREGGLCDEETLGRLHEAALLGDGDKAPQMLGVHGMLSAFLFLPRIIPIEK